MGLTTALGYTPAYSIIRDGIDISAAANDRLLSIRVESRDGGGEADICDITIDDRGWSFALPSLAPGAAQFSLALGYAETGLWSLGTFSINSVDIQWTPKQLVIHGSSVDKTTDIKSPIMAAYDNQTLGQIIGSLAQAGGLSAAVDPILAGIQVPYYNQSQSSMHVLQFLERQYNGMAKVSDGILSFTQRGTGCSVGGRSIGSVTLEPDDFGPSGCNINLTNDFAFSFVKTQWFDRTTNTTQFYTSTTPGDPNSSVPYTVRQIFPSQAEAQSVAESTMRQLNRKCKTGTLVLAKGAPMIRGGQSITIAGCRDGIDGAYIVSRAIHSLAKQGGLLTVLEVYDEGGGADLPEESTDGTLDFSAIPPVTLPEGGIGHM